MNSPVWQTQFGEGPLVAAAIHDGDEVRQELHERLALDDDARLREEDPFTGLWTSIAPTRVVGLRSRFEVDLNRPREKAIYMTPDDAWGLKVWKESLPADCVERSLAAYDDFYDHMHYLLSRLVLRNGKVIVFDLHSYNHRRDGAESEASDPQQNPEVNVGTGTMDRARWAPIVERCIGELRGFQYHDRHLDVRENVKFFGGHFPRWIHEKFPHTVCVISIEFKKFFMDEWTGEADQNHLFTIGQALRTAATGVLEELSNLPPTTVDVEQPFGSQSA